MTTTDAAQTRRRLVEAATEAFAEAGVFNASLVEITRRAGQRNRGAVHYHFGSREGLLVAVLEQHAEFLATREGELLARARTTPDDDLGPVLEAIVRPAVELAETGPSGRRYLVIVGQLVEEFDRVDERVAAALSATGGYDVYALLEQRMPRLDDAAAHRAARPDHQLHPAHRRRPGPRGRAHRPGPRPAADRAVRRQPGRDGGRHGPRDH